MNFPIKIRGTERLFDPAEQRHLSRLPGADMRYEILGMQA
jgi:hypothetical protein